METREIDIEDNIWATSHMRPKARDHGILRSLVGWKGRDRPSSLHTRRWISKGPQKMIMDSYMEIYKIVNVSWSVQICTGPTSKR